MINMNLAYPPFFFFSEIIERDMGIKKNKGNNKTESSGNIFQLNGTSAITNVINAINIKNTNVDIRFKVLCVCISWVFIQTDLIHIKKFIIYR